MTRDQAEQRRNKYGGIVSKENFLFVENMDLIPNTKKLEGGDRLYNDVLKAMEEWEND